MSAKFSLYDAYKIGIKNIFNNIVFFLLGMCITIFSLFLFLLFLGVASYPTLHQMIHIAGYGTFRTSTFGIIFTLFTYVLYIGWIKIALDMQQNQSVQYNYLHKFYYLVPRVFCVDMIRLFLTVVGLILFVVPGIYVYQRLRFAKFFVIDKNQSIMQACILSWNLTKGSVLHLIGYSVISIFIDTLVPILPLTSQVEVAIYRQMIQED